MTYDFSHINVLVVEDNKINQLLVKNMLKKIGILNFTTVDNGTKALNLLEKNKYDFILMDIQLPGIKGYEIAEIIRANENGINQQVPIVAISGDAHDKARMKALEAGMNEYIIKPFIQEELYTTIMKCMNIPVSGSPNTLDGILSPVKTSYIKMNLKQGMDLRFLKKYTGEDGELTIKLVETFLNEVPEAIQKMENLIPLKNWKEVHAVAHKVKSCIAIFELHILKSKIVKIEDLSRELQELEEIPKLFYEFKNGCSEAINNLESELKILNEQKELQGYSSK